MGEIFGAWELLSPLGESELGQSFLARRTADGQRAVLKRFWDTLLEAGAAGVLESELALAAQLKHPSAAAVLEHGVVDGRHYVAVEYVEAATLAHLIRAAQASGEWPLPMARAAQVLGPVLDALAAAHALSPPLLHRDLAPENILVSAEGRVVLTDFGVGRARLRAGGGSGLKRAYVSPEQARGHGADPRSEVFAAGLLLFELVCGRLPAKGGPGEVISQIATGELDAPRTVHPALEEAASAVLAQALAVAPEARLASAQQFAAALAPWANAPLPESLGAWADRLRKVKPPPLAVAVTAAPAEPSKIRAPIPTPQQPATPAKRRVTAAQVVGGIGVLAVLAVLNLPFHSAPALQEQHHGPKGPEFPLEVMSNPTGAMVFVDGVPQRGTPMKLKFDQTEIHTVMLKKAGLRTWTGVVQNTRLLNVDLYSGKVVVERNQPGAVPPAAAAAPTAPAVPAAPAAATVESAPKAEVVYDIEVPPIEVTLTAAHSAAIDNLPVLDVAEGAVLAVARPATVYQHPSTAQIRSKSAQLTKAAYVVPATAATWRHLGVFAAWLRPEGLTVVDLSKTATVPTSGPIHFFSATETITDTSETEGAVTINDAPRELSTANLLLVDADDCFRVRVLSPTTTYRLTLKRAARSTATQPLPAILVSARPATDATTPQGVETSGDVGVRVDGVTFLNGQGLLPLGSHTLTGARSLWVTRVGADGIDSADVVLELTAVPTERRLK